MGEMMKLEGEEQLQFNTIENFQKNEGEKQV